MASEWRTLIEQQPDRGKLPFRSRKAIFSLPTPPPAALVTRSLASEFFPVRTSEACGARRSEFNSHNHSTLITNASTSWRRLSRSNPLHTRTVGEETREQRSMGHGQSSIPQHEVDALVALYDALDGDKWRRRHGWKQPTVDPETWFGVEVMMGHVIAIELPANELHGQLPSCLDQLSYLRVLDLSKNRLHGEIPASLGKVNSLLRIDLSCNDLRGTIPQTICECEHLQELHLQQNALSGELPADLGKLQQLRTLQLQHNNISGSLPSSLCTMKKLTKLSLRGNRMSGKIPREIGNLSSLVFLSLRNNEFTGPIPDTIGKCKALEFLNLSSNQLSGCIPESISDLEDLEYLYLFDNALEGRIPGCISKLKYLKESDFRDNRLRGELPNFLDGCSSLEAVLNKWKNRKASYRHAILGDPVPAGSPTSNSATMFLGKLEYTPRNSSSMFMHPTFDHQTDSRVEEDFGGADHIVGDLARKFDKVTKYLEPESTPVEAS